MGTFSIGISIIVTVTLITCGLIFITLLTKGLVNKNTELNDSPTKKDGLWTKNKPYLFAELLALLLALAWFFYEDIPLSTYIDWINSKSKQYLIPYLGSNLSTLIIYTMHVLVVFWFIELILRARRKEPKVLALGYSGKWLVFLVTILVLYIFVIETYSKNDKVTETITQTKKIDRVSFYKVGEEKTVVLSNHSDIIPIHIRAQMISDGKTTYVVCAKIVSPDWVLALEDFPSEQVEYKNIENTGYQYDLGLTEKVRIFLAKKSIYNPMKVVLVLKTADYWNLDTSNICSNSTH
ncbi:MAG: hypothetical protein R3B60_04365 [Candidatus Paceibacterota bacterium]